MAYHCTSWSSDHLSEEATELLGPVRRDIDAVTRRRQEREWHRVGEAVRVRIDEDGLRAQQRLAWSGADLDRRAAGRSPRHEAAAEHTGVAVRIQSDRLAADRRDERRVLARAQTDDDAGALQRPQHSRLDDQIDR